MTTATGAILSPRPGGKLGRQQIAQAANLGRFRVLTLQDGRQKIIARLGSSFNSARDRTPPPTATSWRPKMLASIAQVLGNDTEGDCVIASKLHMIGGWTANATGVPTLSSTAEALATYHAICGGGDNGCVITDVLDVMKEKGIPVGGALHKIDGYASIDWTNKLLLQVAIEVFGPAVCFGINLPDAWTCTDCTWADGANGNVGGHDVPAVDYDAEYVYVATWGGVAKIPWSAVTSTRYIEECYVALSGDWYKKGNLAPNGIDAATLAADLDAIGHGNIPDPGPGPAPGPGTGNYLTLASALPAGTYAVGAGAPPGSVILSPALAAELSAAISGTNPNASGGWLNRICTMYAAGQLSFLPPAILGDIALLCAFVGKAQPAKPCGCK